MFIEAVVAVLDLCCTRERAQGVRSSVRYAACCTHISMYYDLVTVQTNSYGSSVDGMLLLWWCSLFPAHVEKLTLD